MLSRATEAGIPAAQCPRSRRVQLDLLEAFGIGYPVADPDRRNVGPFAIVAENPGMLPSGSATGCDGVDWRPSGSTPWSSASTTAGSPRMSVLDQFEIAYYESLLRDAFERHRELAGIRRASPTSVASTSSASWTCARIELARGEVVTAHHDAIPRAARRRDAHRPAGDRQETAAQADPAAPQGDRRPPSRRSSRCS